MSASLCAEVAIGREMIGQPEVRALLAQSWAYANALYPAASNHHLDEAGLDRPEIAVFVARLGGVACGCAALVKGDDHTGEIKSLFVDPSARGLKIGRRLLAAIEAHGVTLGLKILRLETGIHQPQALGLYTGAGYRERGPFADYGLDPLSVFMEKMIG